MTEMTIGVAFGPADEADLANSNGYILSLSQGGVVLSAVDIPPGKRTLNFHAIPILFALPASKHVMWSVFVCYSAQMSWCIECGIHVPNISLIQLAQCTPHRMYH